MCARDGGVLAESELTQVTLPASARVGAVVESAGTVRKIKLELPQLEGI